MNLLQRRGLLESYAPPDALVQEEPLLAALTAASIRGTVAKGERNFLINPMHPQFYEIEIGDPLPAPFDPRLLK